MQVLAFGMDFAMSTVVFFFYLWTRWMYILLYTFKWICMHACVNEWVWVCMCYYQLPWVTKILYNISICTLASFPHAIAFSFSNFVMPLGIILLLSLFAVRQLQRLIAWEDWHSLAYEYGRYQYWQAMWPTKCKDGESFCFGATLLDFFPLFFTV